MRAYLLAGGLGSRLRPRVGDLPKILAPFRGRPFLETQVEWLAAAGIGEIVFSLGVGARQVLEYLSARPAGGPVLTAVAEPQPLGTAGAVAFAARGETEPFLVVNGDTLAPFSLAALWSYHREHRALVTLACYHVADAAAKGRVEWGESGAVTGFHEKTVAGPAWISGGLYLCEAELLRHLPTGRPSSLEREIFPALLGAGHRLAAWPADGRLYDIGTPEGLDEAEEAWAADSTGGRP